MKRWGLVLFLVAAISVWQFIRTKVSSPVSATEPLRAPHLPSYSSPDRQAPVISRQVASPLPPEVPSVPVGLRGDIFWRQKGHGYAERLTNLKPERVGEIEAVAPRLHLTPDMVQKLSRWSDVVADLLAATFSPVQTESDWDAAMKRGVAISEAHFKAELRVLGDLDTWNRYYRLKGASMTGHLDDVDDDGEWKVHGPNGGGPLIKPPSGGGPKRPRPDSSEFDHFFAD